MNLIRIGWAGGVGVATAVLSSSMLVPAAGVVGGIALGIDPLANGSLALLGRWGAWQVLGWRAVPPLPVCPPINYPTNPIGVIPPNINTTAGLYQHWLNAPVTTPRKTLV